jgi:septum formation protein
VPAPFVLASASPRRRELLRAAGFTFDVEAVDIDESRLAGEAAAEYADRVARLKAAAALQRHGRRVVLAADTVVVLGGEVLGKPRDEADARGMLSRLSGRAHDVLTAVVVASSDDLDAQIERTAVWFEPLSEDAIAAYVASGEPLDKAGAYAIQGLASRFIPRIEGSYSNVVGLPIALAARLLARHGVQ